MNHVTLIGRLGKDPEVKTTSGGTSIGRLNLATTDREKDKDGNWTDATEWHRITLFGKDADNAAKYMHKGDQVAIQGRIKTTKYTGKDGVEKTSTEILCSRMEFVGSRGGGARCEESPDPQPRSNGGDGDGYNPNSKLPF